MLLIHTARDCFFSGLFRSAYGKVIQTHFVQTRITFSPFDCPRRPKTINGELEKIYSTKDYKLLGEIFDDFVCVLGCERVGEMLKILKE